MQHLLRSGLVSLEEVRDKDGVLENLFARVSHHPFLACFQPHPSTRWIAPKFYPKARL